MSNGGQETAAQVLETILSDYRVERALERSLLDEAIEQFEKKLIDQKRLNQAILEYEKNAAKAAMKKAFIQRLAKFLPVISLSVWSLDLMSKQRRLMHEYSHNPDIIKQSKDRRRNDCIRESISTCTGKGYYSWQKTRKPDFLIGHAIKEVRAYMKKTEFHSWASYGLRKAWAREWVQIYCDMFNKIEDVLVKYSRFNKPEKKPCRVKFPAVKTRCIRERRGEKLN